MHKRSVQSKRSKFSEQIRKKHRQQIIQMNRKQIEYSKAPLIVWLPQLLEQEAYEQIQQILDGLDKDSYELDKSVIDKIKQKYAYHNSDQIQVLMLKLLNRLGFWKQSHFKYAIQLLQKQKKQDRRQDMLKQISIYLENLKVIMSYDNQEQHNVQQLKHKNKLWKQKLQQSFKVYKDHVIQNPSLKIFWMDVIYQYLENVAAQQREAVVKEIMSSIQKILTSLDLGPQAMDEFLVTRFVGIINWLLNYNNETTQKLVCEHVIHMQCFNWLFNFFAQSSINLVLDSLQFCAQLYSASDEAISKAIKLAKCLVLHEKYIGHILQEVRQKNYWSLSNIMGSACYSHILQSQSLYIKLVQQMQKQQRPSTKVQLYHCFLNLWCNCNSQNYKILLSQEKYRFVQSVSMIFQELSEPAYKTVLIERYIFAIYNMLNVTPEIKVHLGQILKKLSDMISGEKDENIAQKMNIVLTLSDNIQQQQQGL